MHVIHVTGQEAGSPTGLRRRIGSVHISFIAGMLTAEPGKLGLMEPFQWHYAFK